MGVEDLIVFFRNFPAICFLLFFFPLTSRAHRLDWCLRFSQSCHILLRLYSQFVFSDAFELAFEIPSLGKKRLLGILVFEYSWWI
jgi:hypothetical protein